MAGVCGPMINVAAQSPAMISSAVSGFLPVAAGAISFAAGVGVAMLAEMTLKEFEENCKISTYQVRWWCAQGIRTAIVGAGTTLTVTALLGLIGGATLITVVSIASFGIGLAVCAGVGVALACYRFEDAKQKDRIEYRKTAIAQLGLHVGSLADDTIQQIAISNNIVKADVIDILKNHVDCDATAQQFFRLRRLLL